MHLVRSHRDYTSHDDAVLPGGTLERGGYLRRAWQAAMRRWQRRRMIAALEAMDDRLLRDIGIDRPDIRRMVATFSDRELRMTPLATSPTLAETYPETSRKAA
ncbi:DUF1127 domain-containing protein [Albidovulum sp.]|uniref:DUF1127 domain-containing protein n=1 Tax=Albidovulum sp. TaxID=1872424 RepID=UPI0039B8BDFF